MYQTDKYAHELRYLLVKVTSTGMIYKLLMFGIDTDSNQFSRLFISLTERFSSLKRQETGDKKERFVTDKLITHNLQTAIRDQ